MKILWNNFRDVFFLASLDDFPRIFHFPSDFNRSSNQNLFHFLLFGILLHLIRLQKKNMKTNFFAMKENTTSRSGFSKFEFLRIKYKIEWDFHSLYKEIDSIKRYRINRVVVSLTLFGFHLIQSVVFLLSAWNSDCPTRSCFSYNHGLIQSGSRTILIWLTGWFHSIFHFWNTFKFWFMIYSKIHSIYSNQITYSQYTLHVRAELEIKQIDFSSNLLY